MLFLFPYCAADETDDPVSANTIIIGEGNSFITSEVTASSGEVLAVINHDDTPHSITSESAVGAFDDTGDFDVLVPSEGTQVLELPEAVSGTVYFFYCRLHDEIMTPADGTITIE
ncbi:MAG: hypothetical protein Q7T11_05820 [Deltaproteobacteria bacterium]|nr:hypothetical protein [Deltaproteobacteria bacterium]